jgi:hypothetical protein
MAKKTRRAGVDDLVKLTGELIDHVKVLVTAVDDLRCEVEWWARNAADQRCEAESAATCQRCRQPIATLDQEEKLEHLSDATEPAALAKDNPPLEPSPLRTSASETAVDDSGRSPASRLDALERALITGPSANWPDDWDNDEPPELPTGRIVQVDEELWNDVLECRPAHVVQFGCCCEEGIGAPYLLAWQSEAGFFLRELTDKEALELQRICLDAQRETVPAPSPTANDSPQTQLGFW